MTKRKKNEILRIKHFPHGVFIALFNKSCLAVRVCPLQAAAMGYRWLRMQCGRLQDHSESRPLFEMKIKYGHDRRAAWDARMRLSDEQCFSSYFPWDSGWKTDSGDRIRTWRRGVGQ